MFKKAGPAVYMVNWRHSGGRGSEWTIRTLAAISGYFIAKAETTTLYLFINNQMHWKKDTPLGAPSVPVYIIFFQLGGFGFVMISFR